MSISIEDLLWQNKFSVHGNFDDQEHATFAEPDQRIRHRHRMRDHHAEHVGRIVRDQAQRT